jgi:hypothetical protein
LIVTGESELTVRFINGTDHTLTMAGKALHAATSKSKLIDKLEEPLTTAIELLRFGALHGFEIDGEYKSGGPIGEDQHDINASMLVLRCMSILPLFYRVSPFLFQGLTE